jgi:hypothetical protein
MRPSGGGTQEVVVVEDDVRLGFLFGEREPIVVDGVEVALATSMAGL